MSNQSSNEPASRPLLPLFLILFFGSGCAALIYEIVWFQMLQLVVGSSAVSLGVLLGTYMGGMCLGSLMLPRFISANRHPLRVYAMLELGIGLFGVLILFGMPVLSGIYSSFVGSGFIGHILRGLFAAVCLLPPTLLMGATLPAMARWIEATPRGVSWLGFFYGGNIAGAVFGCLLAGFYLLRVHDSVFATFVAVAINAVVGLLGLIFAATTPYQATQNQAEKPSARTASGTPNVGQQKADRQARLAYATIALSGMTALGAEVVWTRLLSLTLGGTVYTFSIILAVFLFGLGIGSSIGSMMARKKERAGNALGWCQLLVAVAIAWTALNLSKSIPYWPIDPSLSENVWVNFQLDIARCLWALLPATILWGASFPLALAAASRGQDSGRLVGGIYAANTVGGIFGGVCFSIIFVPVMDTHHCQQLLIGISAVSAMLMVIPLLLELKGNFSGGPAARAIGALAALVVIPIFLISSVSQVPGELIAYGRYMVARLNQVDILYMGEGMNSSVAVTRVKGTNIRNFHVSGKVEASSEPQDMRLQRMLGHIPALIHPSPKSVLVVGCGAGVTLGSFTTYPSVQQITLCELEPLVPKLAAKYFGAENYDVLKDPRTTVIFDDARHYVLTTHDKFDIITSDPIHPWVKGSATLYTKEYFEMVKAHLNPGGIVTQWVPLYESDLDVVKSEIATFFEVFPDGTVWSNDQNGQGYDVVLLGQVGETKINLDEIRARLTPPDGTKIADSLDEVGFRTPIDLFGTYAGEARDLAGWMKGAQINSDRNLRLQYIAGLHPNLYESESIFNDMIVYKKFPEGLFSGSQEGMELLREKIGR